MKYNILSYSDVADNKSSIRNVFISNDNDKETLIHYLKEKVGINNVLMDEYLKSPKKKIDDLNLAFYAQSDTLANSVCNILSSITTERYRVFIPKKHDEGAGNFLNTIQIPFYRYSYKQLKNLKPDAFIVLNDWSKEARRIIAHCRLLKIPTVCIQESIIDFGDKFRRMQHADYVFLQGIHTVLELNHPNCFITGNPRYEKIILAREEKTPGYALINCNFTYGIFEEIREKWLNDIIETLESNNQKYIISQHPRDNGDLSQFKNVIGSSSSTISEDLKDAHIVITRFSSLVHESILLGKPVIYYNPHGETMQYDFEFNNDFLFIAHNKNELAIAVEKIRNFKSNHENIEKYLTIHCLPKNSKPSKNILKVFKQHYFIANSFRLRDLILMLLFLGSFVRFYDKILKLLKRR